MKKKLWVVIPIALSVVGAALLLNAERPEPALAASPAKKADTATEAKLPAGANAAEVYSKLTKEIEDLSKQAMASSSPQEQAGLLDQIQSKLLTFRTRWPNTHESNDAAFQLGAMSFGMQKYEDATKYLNEFLGKASASDHEQSGFAHFYLAESYKALGKYDLTEAEYKLILSKYSDVNSQLTDATRAGMDGLATERKLAVGGEPVAFNVKSIDGKTLSPAAYKGKVLLIDFWATWCGPCVAEMPNVKQVYSKYHGQGFEIVGISLDQSRDRLDQFIKANQIVWPQYFDGKWWNNDVAVRYGIKSIPTTILVDKSGKIRFKSLRGRQLEAAVQQLVAEKG